jgi:2-C-methyl-D-erythritol 4-phosphate cytidylyltransferase
MPLPRFTLILPAGGSSSRFGSNKLLAMLAGEPVIARTLACFLDIPALARVVIASPQPNLIRQACVRVIDRFERAGVTVDFAAGGSTRAESVGSALHAAPADVEWAAIHDAARPLVSRQLIEHTLAAAVEHGAATPALPVPLTIKEATGPLPAKVNRTLPRAMLWAIQTPQIGRRDAFLGALSACGLPFEQVTDDLQLLELAGQETWLVPGEEKNLKLTTPGDLAVADALLKRAT